MKLNENEINRILARTRCSAKKNSKVSDILKKARAKKGLDPEEAGFLVNLEDSALTQELFDTAARIKDEIYGERLVFFAPLYISNFCVNDCEYCNFHSRNNDLARKRLTMEEIEEEVKLLIGMGHKRLLLEFGEDPIKNGIDYVTEVIDKIYSIKAEKGNIRRVNVNISATTSEDYWKLKEAKIGTYQLFQETYHRETYEKIHHGPKQDYDRQITAHERAFEAGIDDLGLGVLFGLYDWKFEVLALITHALYLDKKYGVGPHTVSVPRLCSAPGLAFKSGYPVSDADFLKLIAILRVAVPYTGMIISTREAPKIRKAAFSIGISQASASSVTSVGGYGKRCDEPQFAVCDERKLPEVIDSVLDDKLLPSFCTACYRMERTGEAFMGLSKPGAIHNFCRPNGILTFAEYLEDFAVDEAYKKGYGVINFYLDKMENGDLRRQTEERLARIKEGRRDLYF